MTNENKFFSKIGINYLILGIIALISQIIIVNILSITNPTYLSNINILSGLSSFCNYIIPLPLFYWLMKKLKTTELEKNPLNINTFLLYMGITITLMWIGNIIGLIITQLLSGAIQNDISNPVQQLINSTEIWFNILIISIIAPIFEELLFRKLLIDRSIKYGARTSILLSALLFGLFHGNLNQFFYAFLMGGFFAYVYIKTGKITYTIILHAIINLMGSVVSPIFSSSLMNMQSGITPIDSIIVIGYIIFLFTFLIIGLIGLYKFKDKIFKKLELPLKSIFINFGMICFIGFYIFEIIYQILM